MKSQRLHFLQKCHWKHLNLFPARLKFDTIISHSLCVLTTHSLHNFFILFSSLWNSNFMYKMCTWSIVYVCGLECLDKKTPHILCGLYIISYVFDYLWTKDFNGIWTRNFPVAFSPSIVLIIFEGITQNLWQFVWYKGYVFYDWHSTISRLIYQKSLCSAHEPCHVVMYFNQA